MTKQVEAQLAQVANPKKLDEYLNGSNWRFEQKLDGVRLLVVITPGKVVGLNRTGGEVSLDYRISDALSALNGSYILDGELVKGVFWLFDMPVATDKVIPATPYHQRRAGLEALYNAVLWDSDVVRLLPSYTALKDKAELIRACRDNNSEGIMVKDSFSPYYSGKRSPKTLKLKFWESADCVVTEVGREGKRSIAVHVFDDDGNQIAIGSCTVSEKRLTELKVGEVVELKYLFLNSADGRLYQPSFLRVRTDKAPEECLVSQLKVTSKDVIV